MNRVERFTDLIYHNSYRIITPDNVSKIGTYMGYKRDDTTAPKSLVFKVGTNHDPVVIEITIDELENVYYLEDD